MKKISTSNGNTEPAEFFKGQGQYFFPDPDWGDHLYINNWQGLCGHLKLKDNPNEILLEVFSKYLISLKNTYEDADSLLLNISCYYSMRKDTPFMSADGFDLVSNLNEPNKKIIGDLFRILRSEYAKKTPANP
jgi:hypothetical protein